MRRDGHPPAGHHRAVVRVGFFRDREIYPDACEDGGSAIVSGGSRPLPIGSRSIGVSLQPAVPRRVAPQQSPLPLHQSPTIVTQFQSSEAIKCAAHLHCGRSPGRARRLHRQPECHLYFAHRVSFLCCADKIEIAVGRQTTRYRKPLTQILCKTSTVRCDSDVKRASRAR